MGLKWDHYGAHMGLRGDHDGTGLRTGGILGDKGAQGEGPWPVQGEFGEVSRHLTCPRRTLHIQWEAPGRLLRSLWNSMNEPPVQLRDILLPDDDECVRMDIQKWASKAPHVVSWAHTIVG